MERKIITNTRIMQAKQRVLDLINAELNHGVPISALILIFESVLPEMKIILEQAIQNEKENEEIYRQIDGEFSELKDTVDTNSVVVNDSK